MKAVVNERGEANSDGGRRHGSRRTFLLTLAIVCVLLFLWVTWIHDAIWRGAQRARPIPARIESQPTAIPEMVIPPPAPRRPLPDTNFSVVAAGPDAARQTATEVYPDLLPAGEIPVYGTASGKVAVVDVARIAAALPPASTPEARAKKINEIKRAVAIVAAANNISLVFDKTAMTPLNTPVFFDEGTPDLTELVLQKFKR